MTVLFVALVLNAGVPALRHDWLWPLDKAGLFAYLARLGSGWSADGLGHSNPYPMTYLVVWPVAAIDWIFGSFSALAVLLAAVAGTAWLAGSTIARRFALPWFEGAALAAFLLFNPWTYGKIVAGHLTQSMACMGFAMALCELTRRTPGARRLLLAMVIAALQTQFFLLGLALCLLRVRDKGVRIAALAGLAVFSPTIAGVALNSGELLGWPFTVAFENDQSVALRKGLLLDGYFTQYGDHPYAWLATAATAAMLLCVCAGLVLARSRSTYATAAIACAALLVATGTAGILGPLWRLAILHLPIVGVYRELYDLVGVAACAYATIAAAAIARVRRLRWIAAASALSLIAAWIAYPPSRFFVPAQLLPPPSATLQSAQRYALMPPFQPLTYRGSGAGADPLYAGGSLAAAPLNAMLSTFPANAALTEFYTRGDETRIRRLGVQVVECRPGFSEAKGAISYYGRVAHGMRTCEGGDAIVANPAPIVALQSQFALCTLCSDSGAGNVFYADAPADRRAWFPAPPLREFVDPRRGWIDARLAFASMPAMAQPLGGAFTKQSANALTVHPAPYALVNVQGSLRDAAGAIVARDTHGYRWVRITDATLRCYGACLVAGTGDPPEAPLEAPPQQTAHVSFAIGAPWFVSADLAPGEGGMLRLLQTYAPSWSALAYPGLHRLQHIRIDGTLNGWLVAPQTRAQTIVLFHTAAIVQFAAEALGFAVAGLVIVTYLRTS